MMVDYNLCAVFLVCTVHQVASVLYTLTMKTLPGVLGI